MAYSRFFKRVGLLALPFALMVFLVAWTDPFCLLQTPFIDRAVKQKSAFPLNICLANLIEMKHHPSPNVLLGDSRMGLLSPAEIEKASGAKYLNMSYGGASLNEIADTFWTANEATPLKNVYIGMGFSLYNDYYYSNRTEPAMAIIATPMLYFTNRTVLKGAWFTALLRYAGRDPRLGDPQMTRQELWASELLGQSNLSARYLIPNRYRERLQEIAKYSRTHGIELRFIIFPSEKDLQEISGRYGLDGQYLQFKRDLAGFGRVYDFDVPNDMTANPENYKDPLHFRAPVAKAIIREIWGVRAQ